MSVARHSQETRSLFHIYSQMRGRGRRLPPPCLELEGCDLMPLLCQLSCYSVWPFCSFRLVLFLLLVPTYRPPPLPPPPTPAAIFCFSKRQARTHAFSKDMHARTHFRSSHAFSKDMHGRIFKTHACTHAFSKNRHTRTHFPNIRTHFQETYARARTLTHALRQREITR